MNGEIKSYNINKPMTFAEFKELPNDLKGNYIKMLRHRFNAPETAIAKMMGCAQRSLVTHIVDVGLTHDSKRGREKWAKEEFEAWVRGEDLTQPSEVSEVTEVTEVTEAPVEEIPVEAEVKVAEEVVKAETPVENASVEPVVPAEPDGRWVRLPDIPGLVVADSGTMSFTGNSDSLLANIMSLLNNKNVNLTVSWSVTKEE